MSDIELGKNIISSRVIKNENQPMRLKKPRYLLTSDNFRAIVQRLSPDDERFTPETFQVIKWWNANESPDIKDIVNIKKELKSSDVVEFRMGTYHLSRVGDKKRR